MARDNMQCRSWWQLLPLSLWSLWDFHPLPLLVLQLVMFYRLIARATVEERMMELTKKKMILEHLVVGKLKTQNINQMVSVEDDDLAGLEDVSYDGEDDNYEADLPDGETNSVGAPGRKPYRKRSRVGGMERPPLMEGEGRSLRVLGFNQSQRAGFVQIVIRYANLFSSHIYEGVNDTPTFSDGVPKEGLRVDDVLVRLGQLSFIHDKDFLIDEQSEEYLATHPGKKNQVIPTNGAL